MTDWTTLHRVDIAVGPPAGVEAIVQTDLLTDLEDSIIGGVDQDFDSRDAEEIAAVVEFLKHAEPLVVALLRENAASTVKLPFTGM